MRKPMILIGMGSGREGWLSIDLDSILFTLEIENGKRSVETLTMADLKAQYPNAADLMAGVLSVALRNSSRG